MEHNCCKVDDIEVDKISNLPDLVIDQILCALPIKDAFRTSILSRSWRYRWRRIPELFFDNEVVFAKADQIQALVSNKLVKIVDHILLLRNAPIRKFEMRHESPIASRNIDRWILRLSESPIEEIILEISGKTQYHVPSCLFGSKNLINLELSNCFLKPPTTFGGFLKMKELLLEAVTMSQIEFEVLIAKCPLLERLTLWETRGFAQLNIEAPNLKCIDVDGAFNHISFLNTFQLTEVDINLTEDIKGDRSMVHRSSYNLQNFFDNLPQLCSLTICGYFIKYLSVLQTAGSLTKPCKNVTYLCIGVDFGDEEDISTMLSLLKCSPNLEELEIYNEDGEEVDGEEEQEEQRFMRRQFDCVNYENSRISFQKLRRVKIIGLSGGILELEFVEFLLSNAPVLKKVTLSPSSECTEAQQIELLKALLHFRQCSQISNAEIIYKD